MCVLWPCGSSVNALLRCWHRLGWTCELLTDWPTESLAEHLLKAALATSPRLLAAFVRHGCATPSVKQQARRRNCQCRCSRAAASRFTSLCCPTVETVCCGHRDDLLLLDLQRCWLRELASCYGGILYTVHKSFRMTTFLWSAEKLAQQLAERLRPAALAEFNAALSAVFAAGAEARRRACEAAGVVLRRAFTRLELLSHGIGVRTDIHHLVKAALSDYALSLPAPTNAHADSLSVALGTDPQAALHESFVCLGAPLHSPYDAQLRLLTRRRWRETMRSWRACCRSTFCGAPAPRRWMLCFAFMCAGIFMDFHVVLVICVMS